MRLSVITPERITFSEEVDEISLPTELGEITILKNHIPLIATIGSGAARVVKSGQTFYLAMTGGLVQVKQSHEVLVLADAAHRAEELDEEKIEEARARAQKMLSEIRASDAVEYAALASQIQHEITKLHVLRKHKHR